MRLDTLREQFERFKRDTDGGSEESFGHRAL